MNSRTSWGVITVLVIWVIIFSFVYVFFDSQQKPKIATGKDGGMFGQIVIPRSLDGHYYVRGSINGYPIDFMVDTGASVVSVSKRLAKKANLPNGVPANFSTAGGTVMGEVVSGQSVEAGGIMVDGISVSVGIQGDVALLGQNFLRRVDVLQANDTMTLRLRTQ